MRNFFAPSPDDPVAPPAAGSGGWNGLSGRAKLGILGTLAVVALTAVMWPGFNAKPTRPTGPQDQHPPAHVADFGAAPPPVQEITARVLNDPQTRPVVRTRPIPTEMSLYTLPKSTNTATPAATQVANKAPEETAGLPPTNKAVLVRNPDYLIRAGDMIPCLPIQAQETSRASNQTCRVPVWFRSSNQRRGLLPPGTRLFGHMQEGLEAGQRRLGIVYTLVQTPNFDMPISAPASDVMGRGGLDADIETFFWDRAGAVALYALMDIGISTAQSVAQAAMSNAMRSTNGYSTSFNFQGPSQSLAAREFDHRINRPPVGMRDQALPVTVTVGQNLDFYDACMRAQQVDPMACPLQTR